MVGVTRPMRYTTPLPGTYLVLRPRLIAAAGARFDHRVTTLVAAAGMGKTTLLAQAMAENALAPRGTDVWLACDPADSDERHLLDGLAEAVTRAGLTATRPTSAAALCTCLEPSAGGPVCLVLDDVHEIQPGSTGAALLRDLVISLPQGVSLWLASRRDPPVPLSRLRAQRRVQGGAQRLLGDHRQPAGPAAAPAACWRDAPPAAEVGHAAHPTSRKPG